MTPLVETHGLGRKYRRRWALRECTLSIPDGRVVGLVGPNGAGKTTLLQLAVGLLEPTVGTVEVLGGRPGSGSTQLARVGFVAQDTPAYASLSVANHLRMGAWLNPSWDVEIAQKASRQTGPRSPPTSRSSLRGQRAQLALTVAIAKRPQLLLLDERGGHLPTRYPLLGTAMVGARRFRRRRPRAGRAVHLVGAPAARLTSTTIRWRGADDRHRRQLGSGQQLWKTCPDRRAVASPRAGFRCPDRVPVGAIPRSPSRRSAPDRWR